MGFAHQLAHGLTDADLHRDADRLELKVDGAFDRAANDANTTEEALRLQILLALRRMHRAQALTGTVLELDVCGLGLVLRVATDRVKTTLVELVTEGLVEGSLRLSAIRHPMDVAV